MTSQPDNRDAAAWAQPVDRLHVSESTPGARNINVSGRRQTSPIQGFGRMWQKTYRAPLTGVDMTPAQVIEIWKAHFPEFWPKGNRFFAPLAGIAPGEVAALDLAMPGPDGFSVAGQIRAAGNVPILVVSGESGEGAKVRALEIGADDYLVKPFGRQELLARIAAVMRRVDAAGGPAGGGSALQAGALKIEPGRHEAHVNDALLPLTATEYRLLEALVRAGGDVVPHARLVRAGWPSEPNPDLLWLKPHLARLRAKVASAGGPAVVAVRSVGYRVEAG